MPGSIIKRGKGTWSVVVDIGRDPATGKRRQVWKSIRGTKKDAERLLVKLLHQRDSGMDQPPQKMTTRQYLERWLRDYAEHGVGPRTFERYSGIVHGHLIPALGAIRLAELRPRHIQAYYSQALATGRRDNKGGLSARTVLHHHRVLREALHQAVKWQLLVVNPADAVETPRPVRLEMQALDPEGIRELLGACDADFYPIALLAISTGLRKGELLGLKWADVDLEAGSAQIRRSLQYITGRGPVLLEPKTERSRRNISLSPESVNVLKEHRSRQLERRLAAGAGWLATDLVFDKGSGAPLSPWSVSHEFKRLVRSMGRTSLRFHDLRHTSATLMLRQGVHPKIVSERLGHSTISITLDTYSHVMPGMQDAAAAMLDVYLKPAI